jgi:hypothetical protein
MAMDKHNGHFECGHEHVGSRVRGTGRSPQGHDARPYRRAGQLLACDAGPSWLAVEAA